MSACSRNAFALIVALGLAGVGLGGVGQARAQTGDVTPDVEKEVDVGVDDEAILESDTGDVEVDTEVDSDAGDVDAGDDAADVAEAEPAPPPESGGLVADDEDVDENPLVREERRRVAHQTAMEQTEPRPPEMDVPAPDEPEWTRHIEVGADAAFVMRPFHNGVVASDIRYESAIAWGLHVHWNALEWLRLTPYFLDVHHGLDIPQGALVAPTDKSIPADWVISDATVTTYVFGLKVQPTLNFTPRLRAWLTAGIGWGRFKYPEMTVNTRPGQEGEPDPDDLFVIRQRKSVFVEFPLGLGVSFDIIDRWLALEFESTAAPMTGQSGNAHETFQAVGPEGEIRHVGRFGAAQVSFVQALSFSLIL